MLSSSPAALGLPIEAKAVVTYPADSIAPPVLETSTGPAVAVSLAGTSGLQSAGGVSTQSFDLRLMPLAIGKIPVAIKWILKTTKGDVEIQSRPLVLNVPPPDLKADAQIQDIKGPMAARPPLWPWLIGLVLLAIAYAAYRFWKSEQAAAEALAPVDDRTPEEIARDELAELAASDLWPSRRYKEFYFLLGEIARRYIERVFEIPATKLTTPELLHYLRQAEIDRLPLMAFKEAFERGDLVKFAKMAPEEGQGAKDIEAILLFIEKTAPKPNGAVHEAPKEAAR